MQGFFLENHYMFDSSRPERSKHSLVPIELHSGEVMSHLLGSRACVGHRCLPLHQHSGMSHKPQLNGPCLACLAQGMQDPTPGGVVSAGTEGLGFVLCVTSPEG